MTQNSEAIEGYLGGKDPLWNQSFYYNFYDPESQLGGLIRVGVLENRRETNSWFIIFRGASPVFTRTNINLPYTKDRPLGGMEVAGLSIKAVVPLKETQISFADSDFSADLRWEELHPMVDCMAISHAVLGGFAGTMINVHWEGTSRVNGYVSIRGDRIKVNGNGFRDISAGPRNWNSLHSYATAWPIFENGMALAAAHAKTVDGESAYLKMLHDGREWLRVGQLDDQTCFSNSDPFSVTGAHWAFTDEKGARRELTAKPIFRWLFPVDGFVLCEQMMAYTLDDKVRGYGIFETGYRLPWQGP